MVSKGYTAEEADTLLTKEQEILRDMDNIRIYGNAHYVILLYLGRNKNEICKFN